MSEQERRWEYAVVEIGQASRETQVDVTGELIAAYAGAVRNDNPAYSADDGAVPRPRYAVDHLPRGAAAPWRHSGQQRVRGPGAREGEPIPDAVRQVRGALVRAAAPRGRTITSFGHVVDKYVRRGNKFVTIRVEASNQAARDKVGEYDYTCIFEYAQGQKRPE